MKRNLKKAMAFAMAVATVVANFGVSSPVSGAEYSEPVKLLDAEYDMYGYLGDSMYLTKYTEAEDKDGLVVSCVEELKLVDENGEVSTLEVKDTEGNYKYKDVSFVSDGSVALIAHDDSYVLLYEDGSYFGNGEEKYDDILFLEDGNYLVTNDTMCNVVDKSGAVIAENLFEPISCDDMYWWPYYIYNEYIILGRQVWEDDDYVGEVKIFDTDYNEVDKIELGDVCVAVLGDKLAVSDGKDVTIYNSDFEELDFSYSRDDLQDPAESVENEPVLCDYDIIGIYGADEYGEGKTYFELYIELYYEDCTGDSYYNSYEWVLFDCETFEELSSEEVYGSFEQEDEGYDFGADGVICKTNNETYEKEYYYNSELLYTELEILEFVIEKKSLLADGSSGYFLTETGVGDAMFIEVGLYGESNAADCYTLYLTKETGYSLEGAEILDMGIYYMQSSDKTMIVFDDFSIYFEGEFYDSLDAVNVFRSYDSELENMVAYAYCLKKGEEGSYTWVLYNAKDEAMAEIPEFICDYNQSGIMIVRDDIENDDGSVESYYGCYYFDRTLTSSEEVLEELEKVEEGESVSVKVEQNEPIKSEIIETIKDKDVDVVIKTKSGITWTINGKDVTGTELQDVDLTVDIVDKVVPETVVNDTISKIKLGDQKVEEVEKIELSIAHTGDFGFKASLTMDVKTENVGKYANLFYYNPKTLGLEFMESVLVDEFGKVSFGYTHASDYVILISDAQYVDDTTDDTTTDDTTTNDTTTDDTIKDDTTTNDTTTDNDSNGVVDAPDTGDESNVGLLIAVIVVAAVALVLVQMRRTKAK